MRPSTIDGPDVTQTVQITRQMLEAQRSAATPKKPKRIRRPSDTGATGYLLVVLVALTAATTSLVYLKYFSGKGFLVGTGVAACAGALVAGIAGARRWRVYVTVPVIVLGFLLVGIFAVFRETLRHGVPTFTTLGALGSGLLGGWARMLSVTLPADPSGELVIAPALITFTAAAVATILVLRTRALLPPLVPLVLAFGIGLALTAGRPVGGLVLTGAVLGELLVLALIRAGTSDPLSTVGGARRAAGRFAFGLPVVLVSVAVGVAGAHYLPVATGQDRFQLAELVDVPLNIQDNVSPLSTLKGTLREPSHELFTVRADGDGTGIDRVRTAALEHYDGALWSSRDQYLLAGKSLPARENLTNPRRVEIEVAIRSLPSPYLPEIGAPVAVTAPRAGFSAQSGTLVTDAPNLDGLTYRLTAELPSTQGLDKAIPELSGGATRYTELPPGLPEDLRAKGSELAGLVSEPYAKLVAIQDYLQKVPYSLDTRPGHSYDALRRLVSPNAVDRVGYAEQLAAAFVVLARSQGIPARVAVGYLLKPEQRKDGTYSVTSANAHAWAEVDMQGYGWVAFEPTDPQRKPPDSTKQDKTEAGKEIDKPDDSTAASTPSEDPNLPKLAEHPNRWLDWALWVLIALGTLLVAIPITTAVWKYSRRRSRRLGSRATQIIGAWQESTDQLVQHGFPIAGSWTALEIATDAQRQLGEPAGAVAVLAPLVTSAMYCPDEPDEAAVREAWQLETRLRRELRKARGPLRVLRGWFDPRPLFAARRDARRRRRTLDKLTRG